MNKILFIKSGVGGGWYMEAHYEYLIRYLSDEFFFEIADLPYPPYENFLNRWPETSPLQKNPDDFDLLVPILASHWGVTEREKYAHKMGIVQYEPGEGEWHNVAVVGTTTPVADEALPIPHHKLSFGIDTELFRPYPMTREDDLLHVGIVGTYVNPRRQIVEGIKPLFDMPGVRFMFFPSNWVNNGGHRERMDLLGGKEFLNRVVTGDKSWPGIPNVYNRLDVLVRIDNSYGFSFPTLEAAACAVPVIATYQGIDHFITEAGGGILLKSKDSEKRWPFYHEEELVAKLRDAIEYLRDNKLERISMGVNGRLEVRKNWSWDKAKLDAWREFFREGIKNANKH